DATSSAAWVAFERTLHGSTKSSHRRCGSCTRDQPTKTHYPPRTSDGESTPPGRSHEQSAAAYRAKEHRYPMSCTALLTYTTARGRSRLNSAYRPVLRPPGEMHRGVPV